MTRSTDKHERVPDLQEPKILLWQRGFQFENIKKVLLKGSMYYVLSLLCNRWMKQNIMARNISISKIFENAKKVHFKKNTVNFTIKLLAANLPTNPYKIYIVFVKIYSKCT